jgi:hypothetical protein
MAILHAQLNSVHQQKQTQQPRKVQTQSKKRRPVVVDEDTNEEEEEYEEDFLYYYSEEEAYVERGPQKRYREVLSSKAKAASPFLQNLRRQIGHQSSNYMHPCQSMMVSQTQGSFFRNTLLQYLWLGEMM